ncbi:hypothetical protein H0H93_013814 [Arthromyces matolae]|nr:hypothetical protein H0H93_013814 [Arthromyces matolae]
MAEGMGFARVWVRYYTSILTHNPDSTILTNWDEFVREYSTKFGIPNVQAEAERNLMNLRMGYNERFTSFIIRFEEQAFETGWNMAALRWVLEGCLPKRIKDMLIFTPEQKGYPEFRALVEHIDHRWWTTRASYPDQTQPTFWRPSGYSNYPSNNPAGQNNAQGVRRVDNTQNPSSASRAPINPRNARLNAAEAEDHEGEPGFGNLFEETNVKDASKGNSISPENRSEALEEVMQAGMPVPHGNPPPQPRIPDDVKAARRKEGSCLLCGEFGHFIQKCPKRNNQGRAVYILEGDTFEFQYEENEEAI